MLDLVLGAIDLRTRGPAEAPQKVPLVVQHLDLVVLAPNLVSIPMSIPIDEGSFLLLVFFHTLAPCSSCVVLFMGVRVLRGGFHAGPADVPPMGPEPGNVHPASVPRERS